MSQQMKNLLCKKLASCLCMKQPPSTLPEPRLLAYKNVWSVDISKSNRDNGLQCDTLTAVFSETTENEDREKLLKKICYLLESRVNKDEEERYDDDKENEMKNDWMLAAAVLDRLCAIAVTVFFVAGSLVLFILFAAHP